MTAPAAQNPWLRMALNNAWANATLYRALIDMPDGTFSAPRAGFFPSLAATMNHIYEVDLYYLDALDGGGLGRAVFQRVSEPDAAKLATLQAEADRRFASIAAALTMDRLSETCVTERSDGAVCEIVANTILHLVQHQIHHRGQAHGMLSQAGMDPPQLDEFYLDFDRAPTAEAFW